MTNPYWHYANPDTGSEAILYPSGLGTGAIIEIRSHPAGSTANPALVIAPRDIAEFTAKLAEFAGGLPLEFERYQLPEEPCKRCGGGFQPGARAWAVVWDGQRYWLQVRYVLTMPFGPYHTGCIGRELNERNAPQPEEP